MSLKSWKQFTSPPKNSILSQEAMTKTAKLFLKVKMDPRILRSVISLFP